MISRSIVYNWMLSESRFSAFTSTFTQSTTVIVTVKMYPSSLSTPLLFLVSFFHTPANVRGLSLGCRVCRMNSSIPSLPPTMTFIRIFLIYCHSWRTLLWLCSVTMDIDSITFVRRWVNTVANSLLLIAWVLPWHIYYYFFKYFF
jgi:hypothetical protein